VYTRPDASGVHPPLPLLIDVAAFHQVKEAQSITDLAPV
jgi:hypothetical protein